MIQNDELRNLRRLALHFLTEIEALQDKLEAAEKDQAGVRVVSEPVPPPDTRGYSNVMTARPKTGT